MSANHQLSLSKDYLQKLAIQVGSIIESTQWSYLLPTQVKAASIISIGRDGTTMPILGEGYREAMSGTIAFYDNDHNRLHTIYLAQAPQYGKSDFDSRFSALITKVKSQFKDAFYVGLADGAKDNWTFLSNFVHDCILDYWHVCEYLTKASKAYSRSKYEQKQWLKAARNKLKDEANSAASLLKEMKTFRRKKKVGKTAKEGLETAITYFTNHLDKMNYKEYQDKDYPIGSGVTEAACKVIVKQRMNHSGMRWHIPSAQKILNLRCLYRTQGRSEQFWKQIDQQGIAA